LQFLQLCLYGWGFVNSLRFARQASSSFEGARHTGPSAIAAPTPEPSFTHDMPLEQIIARSSAIMLVTYIPEGKRYKAIVAEFVKRSPNTVVYYSVGDEYPTLSYTPKAGETCGEGQVVFMVGSPAEMRVSYSFTNDQISGFGDMPLKRLRELAKVSATGNVP